MANGEWPNIARRLIYDTFRAGIVGYLEIRFFFQKIYISSNSLPFHKILTFSMILCTHLTNIEIDPPKMTQNFLIREQVSPSKITYLKEC